MSNISYLYSYLYNHSVDAALIGIGAFVIAVVLTIVDRFLWYYEFRRSENVKRYKVKKQLFFIYRNPLKPFLIVFVVSYLSIFLTLLLFAINQSSWDNTSQELLKAILQAINNISPSEGLPQKQYEGILEAIKKIGTQLNQAPEPVGWGITIWVVLLILGVVIIFIPIFLNSRAKAGNAFAYIAGVTLTFAGTLKLFGLDVSFDPKELILFSNVHQTTYSNMPNYPMLLECGNGHDYADNKQLVGPFISTKSDIDIDIKNGEAKSQKIDDKSPTIPTLPKDVASEIEKLKLKHHIIGLIFIGSADRLYWANDPNGRLARERAEWVEEQWPNKEGLEIFVTIRKPLYSDTISPKELSEDRIVQVCALSAATGDLKDDKQQKK